ncbi:MAG: response regulator transcription factor [Bacteroidetes bacterium]|nr:response regulator transcription factor [Bacteroidota bacterium]MCW5896796.1 response regulator transcription factor [Bacteroidota bacterium]
MKTILIVEDDASIRKGLEDALTAEHFTVVSATDGVKGYTMAKRENIDLIILDLMLPEKNGQEVCRDLRKEGINTPIIMLTSKKQEMDKVLGFELGADDYVTKPFSIRELIARIHALLRRKWELKKDIDEYAFGSVEIDFKKQEATKNSKSIKFSAREFEILKYFIQHEGEVVTREMLLNDVWGYENYPTTRTIDNFILSLRKKIEDNHSKPRHLLTIHTSGYKFVK